MVQYKTDTLPCRIKTRQAQYENRPERQQYDTVVRELIQYCRPDLAAYVGKEGESTQGEKRGTVMYTSKVATDLLRAGDAFVGNLLHPGDWFRYRTRIPFLNDNNDVQRWLQEREEQFNEIFLRSNFYIESPGAVVDAMSLGNHCIWPEYDEKTGTHTLMPIHMLSSYWSVDKRKAMTGFHQKHFLDAMEAYRMFGKKCSHGLIRAVTEENRPLDKYEFIQAVYMTDDPVIGDYKLKYPNRKFVEFWIQVDNEKNESPTPGDDGILDEQPYNQMPVILWPYRRTGDEAIGRGALHLPSVKRLNNHHKTIMLTAQRAAQQPLVASSTLSGRIKLQPDGITFTESENETIRPLYGNNQIGYPFGIEYLDRMEQEIEMVLGLPMFLQLSQLAEKKERITATQVLQTLGEKYIVAGPRLVPMERYYLAGLHERFWQIEADAGRIPDAPDILMYAARDPRWKHFDGDLIVPEFMGPLHQIQQLFLYMRRMEGLLGSVGPLLEMDPRAARKINVIRSVEHILDSGGWPQDCIVPDEEIAAQEEAEAQLQRLQIAGQLAEQESKATKNLSRRVERDSPMAALAGAA